MKLKIATSQFSVSSNIVLNRDNIVKQTRKATKNNCDIVHFPEGSLSGYAGVDFGSFDKFDWDLLSDCSKQIVQLARELNIWIILGSTHRLTNKNKPHNSLYIINDNGNIVDRYDKLFCAGDDTGEIGDLAHYSSGNHFTCFEVKGIKCSVQICHDYRYPELYRELKKKKVQIVFHSYHAANMDTERQLFMESQIGKEFFKFNFGTTYPEITMPSTMISYGANNHLWISCSNSSAKESCWGSFVVRPDGVVIGRLEKNTDEIVITEIDTEQEYYDSTKFWRERAMNGQYYSGSSITDPRSDNRHEL